MTFRRSSPHRRARWSVLFGAVAALTVLVGSTVLANHPEVSLPGANFEIDTNANLLVNDPAPSIDWASVNETRQPDLASGSGDNSFGQGSKEDTAVPSVVDGSIPPNKSDLTTFGVYLEENAAGRFLNLYWHRVQDPSGTTNMDFEFNQSETLSVNGVTPVRTAGDLLIQYDLSQGGTNPQLFLSRWLTTGAGSLCEASNSTPCWSDRVNLTAAGDATGSINTTGIAAGAADGLGAISARTFGEAQLDFDALTGGGSTTTCASFGSAYLKSRSSDSFSAAMKDFIAPTPLDLNNCGTVIIRKQTDPDEDPNTTSFGYTKSFNTSPAIANTFTLTDDGVFTNSNVLQGSGYTVVEDVIPTGWDFVSVNCSASTGVTPSINGATVTFAIDAATDILDCTYTNRARGTVIIEKITDDGQGSFDFTSTDLGDGSFTLVTTAAGAAGKDSEPFADLAPGTYDAAETVPTGWTLVSFTCDDGSLPSAIGVSAGETVTCTAHNARQRGALLIDKDRKHAAAVGGEGPHANVTFTVTGGEIPAGGTVVVTDANGRACITGLVVSSLVGNYSVAETVPTGYHVIGSATQSGIAVVAGTTCATATSVNFENMPLTDINVTVNSQVDGGTASSITCDWTDPDEVGQTNANGDGSLGENNLEPGTYTCVIVVDP